MSLAQAKRDYSYRYQISPQTQDLGQKNRKKRCAESRHGHVIVFGFALICFALGLSIVAQTARLNAKGYYLYKLQNEVQSLGREADIIRLEVAQMRTLARVENIAVAQLGMQRPGTADWGVLPESQRLELPTQTVASALVLPPGQKPAARMLNKLLASWFGLGSYAKASEN